MNDGPTRGEFDMLHQMVNANQVRLEAIGALGVVEARLAEVAKDLTELKTDVNARFDAHQRVHDADQVTRAVNRRWAVALVVAILGAIGGLYPYLHVITAH